MPFSTVPCGSTSLSRVVWVQDQQSGTFLLPEYSTSNIDNNVRHLPSVSSPVSAQRVAEEKRECHLIVLPPLPRVSSVETGRRLRAQRLATDPPATPSCWPPPPGVSFVETECGAARPLGAALSCGSAAAPPALPPHTTSSTRQSKQQVRTERRACLPACLPASPSHRHLT
jgi:hypothetical protein